MSVPKFTDFRRLPEDMPARFSYELEFLIRQTRDKQEWLRENLIESEESPLDFVGSRSVDADPKLVANEIRHALGFDASVRDGWRDREAALSHWIDLVEGIGVYVFQRGTIDVAEARGFTLVDTYAPFIFLNSGDAKSARVFTLIHELAHVWVGESGVSNLNLPRRPAGEAQVVEVFCNAVAGEAIAPEAEVSKAWTDTAGSVRELKDRVSHLSDYFKVSPVVVLRRLLSLRLISQRTYESLEAEFDRDWRDARRKKMEQLEQKKDFKWPVAKRAVFENGRAFCRSVVSAYRSGEISPRDLSGLLNLKLNHLPKLISELAGERDNRGRKWRRPA